MCILRPKDKKGDHHMSTQGSSKIVNSDRGPSPGEAYGVAGLTQKLQGISFPISKDDLLKQYGNQRFEWTKDGETLTLRDCLKNLPNQVQSITQITQEVSEVVKQKGARSR
jgi:hypothetical protein